MWGRHVRLFYASGTPAVESKEKNFSVSRASAYEKRSTVMPARLRLVSLMRSRLMALIAERRFWSGVEGVFDFDL